MTHNDAATAPPRRALADLASVAGALVSLGMIVGMVVWGYQLAARDVTGVPVIRALEGPMRVAPDEPGGKQAAFQGLSVNDVAAEGVAATAPERVILAPPPVTLDLAAVEMPPSDMSLVRAAVPLDPGQGPEDAAPAPDRTAAAAPSQPGSARVVPPDVPGVARSPVPPPRPADSIALSAGGQNGGQAGAPQSAAGRTEIDPDSIAPGTRLVQLGAFEDAKTARSEWQELAGRFAAHFESRDMVIQQAENGGRVFYRLRAHGFADESEARRFCAVLLADQAPCIPVLVR